MDDRACLACGKTARRRRWKALLCEGCGWPWGDYGPQSMADHATLYVLTVPKGEVPENRRTVGVYESYADARASAERWR